PVPLPPPPPPPDPAVERARATAAIQAGAEQLMAAVNARSDGLSASLSSGAGRDRLLRFVQDRSPTASLLRVAAPTLSAGRAASVVTMQFQWRGPFGDTRREDGRFEVEAS